MQISDPDKFQMATQVVKNSRTGITSNKRLLVIKRGHLYYYSNVPKAFKGDPKILDSLHQLPKCSIQILNIKKINGFQNTSSYFSIQFEAKHMMQRDDIRKTLTLQQFNFAPKDTKQIITWQFTCDNKFIKHKWVSTLQTLQAHYKRQKVNIQKFFQNINKKQDQVNNINFRNSTIPWRDDQLIKSSSNDNLKQKKNNQDGLSFLNMTVKNTVPQYNTDKIGTKKQVNNQINPSIPPSPSPLIPEKKDKQKQKQKQKQKEKQIQRQKQKQRQKQRQRYIQRQKEKEKQRQISQSILLHSIDKKNSPIKQTIIEDVINQGLQSPKYNINDSPILRFDKLSNQEYEKQSQEKIQSKQYFSLKSLQNSEYEQNEFQQILSKLFPQNFQQKLKIQQKFIQMIQSFKKKSIKYLTELINNKKINIKQDTYEKDNIFIKVALVDTQTEEVNGKQKINYNQDKIKKLKWEFKIYQDILTKILNCLKNKIQVDIRIPLCIFVQYKGISALIYQENTNTQYISATDNIKKQIKQLEDFGYNPTQFYYKKTSLNFIVAYIKKPYKIDQKHSNVLFEPPIDHKFLIKANLQKASTSIASLQKYIKTLKKLKQFKGICPKSQIIEVLEYCYFCKIVRKIYRSTHGQIDQQIFFNMLFNKDSSILELLQKSGCDYIPQIKGQLIDFLEYYLGISFQINPNLIKSKNMILNLNIHPIIRQYPFNNLQLVELLNNFSKYINDNQHDLANQVLKIKENMYFKEQQLNKIQLNNYLQYIKNKIESQYNQQNYQECIKLCKHFLEKSSFPNFSTYNLSKFPIYIFLIKSYSQISQVYMSKIFKQFTQFLIYNFSNNNSIFIKIWILIGYYYKNKFNNSIICNKLIQSSIQLCQNYFGKKSKQMFQLFIQIYKIYQNQNQSILYFKSANSIIQYLDDKQCINTLIIQNARNIVKNQKKQQYQKILKQITQIRQQQIQKYQMNIKTKELLKLQSQLALKADNKIIINELIECLWNLSMQKQSLELAYKVALMELKKRKGTRFLEECFSIIQKQCQKVMEKRINKKEQILIFEEKKKQYLSNILLDLIIDILEDNQQQYINGVISIIGVQDIRKINGKFGK